MLGGSGSSNDSDNSNSNNRNVTHLCLINQYLRKKGVGSKKMCLLQSFQLQKETSIILPIILIRKSVSKWQN